MLITILWIDIQNSKKISEMTAKDLKNNYRNIRIVVLCFAIYILLKWFSPFLIVLDYNFIQILIPFIISGIVIFPIVVIGYKLLGDKGN